MLVGNSSDGLAMTRPYLWNCDWQYTRASNRQNATLAVWGTEYPQSHEEVLYKIPVDVNVYRKELLLWRGDLVHGGSLADPKGELGALRQHAFLPLHKEHVGMSVYDGSRTNGCLGNPCRNPDRNFSRYDTFLNGLDGEPFP